jgi:hypothetical protein
MASGEVPGVMPGIWEEPAAGASGEDVPVGCNYHPDGRYRTARYVTRRSGGVGGERPRGPFLSRLGSTRGSSTSRPVHPGGG